MQKTVHHFLNESRTGNVLIALLILTSLIGFTLETEFQNYTALLLLNLGIAMIFAVEYAGRIWAAPLKYPEKPRPRLYYIFSGYGLIDLVAFLPALILPMTNGSVVLRILRIMRLFQLMKIQAVSRSILRIGRAIKKSRVELLFSIGISLAMIFLGAVLMYVVEGPTSPENFGSVPRALWWSMATLTTVGYGDVYPATALGKILASCIALLGIVAVAMPAGILASAFMQPDIQEAIEDVSSDE